MRIIFGARLRPLWLVAFCANDRPATAAWLGQALIIATFAGAAEGAQAGREGGVETFVIPCRYGRG